MTSRFVRYVNRTRLKSAVDVLTSTALMAAAIVMIWRGIGGTASASRPASAKAIEDLESAGLVTDLSRTKRKGDIHAPIVLIEFADFECPFCGNYVRDTYDRIEKEFISTGRVQYAFRHFPLERTHRLAMAAAEAAECAGAQAKFWEMHRRLLLIQTEFNDGTWSREANALKLNLPEFEACVGKTMALSAIRNDIAEGKRLGVSSTPTFLIGRASKGDDVRIMTRVRGSQAYSAFESALT